MRRRFVELALVALAIGIVVLLYRGPGRGFIRGNVGDVAATMLVYALLGLAWQTKIWVRASVTMAIATAIELGQTWWKIESSAGSLLLGSTFDPWDIVAYACGTAIAIGFDRITAAALLRPDPASSVA